MQHSKTFSLQQLLGHPVIEFDLLNLGCGTRTHDLWTNVDFGRTQAGVISHDLATGIPFPDSSFRAVYHSHVLEHFERSAAKTFIAECYRVLRPGGRLRVVVPDLEQIARLYLDAFDALSSDPSQDASRYDWIMHELYDQTVRNRSGGGVKMLIENANEDLRDIAVSRWGAEIAKLIESNEIQASGTVSKWKQRAREFAKKTRSLPLRLLLGRNGFEALRLGRFRQSGEVHFWMYDRYSLSRLIGQAHFVDPVQVTATQSAIVGWSDFCLDADANGRPHKPDSLYMEALKPDFESNAGRVR